MSARTGLPSLLRAGVRERAEAGSPHARRVVLRVLAGVLVLGLAVAAVLGWSLHREAAARAEADAALQAARSSTEQLLSIGSATLEVDLARANGLVTEPFAARFKQTAADVIVPNTRDRQLLTTTKVMRAAVLNAQPGRVEVLVFVNQFSSAAGQAGPAELTTSQVRETMTLVGDRWLISDFQVL